MEGTTFGKSNNFTDLLHNLFLFRSETDTTLFLLCQLVFALIVIVLVGISLIFDYVRGPTCVVCQNRVAVEMDEQ